MKREVVIRSGDERPEEVEQQILKGLEYLEREASQAALAPLASAIGSARTGYLTKRPEGKRNGSRKH